MSVVLHEICHGLGFSGIMEGNVPSAGQARWGWGVGIPGAYDHFTVNAIGQSFINTAIFPNSSTQLFTQLTTADNVFFSGANAVAAYGLGNVPLYAPAAWSQGSSYSHLAESFNGTPNALMTYSISTNEADHDPGPVTLGILKDIGWSIVTPDTAPPAAPTGLAATPASWTNSNVFSINWSNPSDPSGIAGAWYKVGAVPTTDTDGSYTTNKPFNAASDMEGSRTIYVWLQDGAGNKSAANRATTTLYYDATAPASPIGLAATPSGWTNVNSFSVNWSNPADTSGIAGAYYKIGSAPLNNTDGTYTAAKPITGLTTVAPGQTIYVWLKDAAGNVNSANRSSASLNYEITAPTDGVLTATKGNASVSLSWTAASDAGGSGLAAANRYKVVRATGGYPANCASGTQVYLGNNTTATDNGLVNGTTYYYRVCAYDNAGNVSTGATATATLTVAIQFNTSPAGKLVTVDSVDHAALPWSTTWNTASSHNLNVPSPQAGAAGTQYVFSSWSDGGVQGHSVAPVVDTTYTANFTTQYTLATSAGANGSITPASGTWFNSGSTAALTAVPSAGYVVSSWTGDCSGAGTALSTSVTMSAPRTCSVSFASCGGDPAKLAGGSTYASLAAAYAAAVDGGTIQMIATTLSEGALDFSRTVPTEIDVTLAGGYGCGFTSPSSVSIISGSLTVTKGSVTADGVLIL